MYRDGEAGEDEEREADVSYERDAEEDAYTEDRHENKDPARH